MARKTPAVRARSHTFTEQEMAFVRAYAVSADRAYAEFAADLPTGAGVRILGRPEVKAKIASTMHTRIVTEGAPLALKTLMEICASTSEKAFTARVNAAKIILEVAYNKDITGAEKELNEMTAEEIDAKIAQFEAAAANGPRVLDEADAGEDVTGLGDLILPAPEPEPIVLDDWDREAVGNLFD